MTKAVHVNDNRMELKSLSFNVFNKTTPIIVIKRDEKILKIGNFTFHNFSLKNSNIEFQII